jgi:phosphate transport system permease protein
MIAAASKRARFFERLIFWMFRLGTYFVLLCATYIFLDITIKGAGTVFTTTPPFVNVK